MSRLSGAATCLALVLTATGCGGRAQPETPVPDAAPGISITAPEDGATVGLKTRVSGAISGTDAREVWVIVRAVGVSTYWVRNRAPVGKGGTWTCEVQVGAAETSPGNSFEILAVAGPTEPLTIGDRLPGWPASALASEITSVIRN